MPFIRSQPEPPAKAFDLATPAHVYWKVLWELANLKQSEAKETEGKNSNFESAYHAYNFAVTAWHLTDWVWAASDATFREHLSKYFGDAPMAKKKNLFDAIAARFRAIHICGQIANGSKHYIAAWGEDPSIEVKVLWVSCDGEPDDRVHFSFQKKLAIRDGEGDFRPAIDVFKEAVRAWELMLGNWGFIEDRYIGADSEPPAWA